MRTRQLNVSVIGDSPFCVLGLEMMLGNIGVNVLTVYSSLTSLREYEPRGGAIIIDMYFTDIMHVYREAHKINATRGGRFVIFTDTVRSGWNGMTFIRRGEQLDTIRKYLLQGIIGGRNEISIPYERPVMEIDSNITRSEAFVLKEWLRGQTVTDIARLSNRSVKTISSHKRSAMKKLKVSNNCELYGKLLKGQG